MTLIVVAPLLVIAWLNAHYKTFDRKIGEMGLMVLCVLGFMIVVISGDRSRGTGSTPGVSCGIAILWTIGLLGLVGFVVMAGCGDVTGHH